MKPASTLLKSILVLGALAMLAFASSAQATISCNISNPATLNIAYGSLYNLVSGSFTVTCSSNSNGAHTASYQLAASVSANASGTQRRAGPVSGIYLNYNLTVDSACTTAWNATSPNYNQTTLYTTPSLSTAGVASDTHTFFYYVCIPAGQTTAPAGTYSDTTAISFVNMSVSGGTSSFTNGAAFSLLNITTQGTCTFATPPGNMTFAYTSFSTTAATASTTFAAQCTNMLPYTMALDATSGTINGITYTLALSATSATGNGAAQGYTINGSIAAGQGGTCSTATCTGTQIRTLTITY
jgi:spore coat protein U-like protein